MRFIDMFVTAVCVLFLIEVRELRQYGNHLCAKLDPLSHFKARINVKAALTSLNSAFLPISRSHFKRR